MRNKYILYILTLISSFAIYWLFGSMMTVAAGVGSVPTISFFSAVVQFGAGSWLFLQWPKTGRWLSIVLGVAMLAWPVSAIPWVVREGDIWGYLLYGIPIILCSAVIYGHIQNIGSTERPNVPARVVLAFFPAGLFILYIIYLLTLINR